MAMTHTMTNGIGHRVIAISRIFLKDQWKFLPWWLLSKSEYNVVLFNKSGSPYHIDCYNFALIVKCKQTVS